MKQDASLNQGGSCGGGKNWSDADLIASDDGLDEEMREKKSQK